SSQTQHGTPRLSRKLRSLFAEWIRGLPIPQPGSVPLVRCIDPTARYLSFNYTPTLQRLYGVPEPNVLHIHGRSSDADGEMVVGHGWKRTAGEMLREQINEDTDMRVGGGYRLIDNYRGHVQTHRTSDRNPSRAI